MGQVGRRWEACQPASPPRGRQYSVLSEAGEAQVGDYEWQSRAPDHWRALECLSQTPLERRQDKTRRPRQAMGYSNERCELSLEGCPPSAVTERGWRGGGGGGAADCEAAGSEAVERTSPGRAVAGVAVGEFSATGGAGISTSGNGISLRCG